MCQEFIFFQQIKKKTEERKVKEKLSCYRYVREDMGQLYHS